MIGRKIIYKDTLTSTNNYIAKLVLENNIEDGTVIMAGNQTDGKGQRGSVWDSEPYENLSFSCFLKHDNLAVNEQFILNQVVSLAVCDFLNSIVAGFKIKWPNDLVFGNSKIAGILIENQLDQQRIKSSIVGIGININQTSFGDFNATSLKLISNINYKVDELGFKLIEFLNNWYSKLKNFNFELIQKKYLSDLWLLDEKSQFEDADGKFEGKIIGINENGCLILEKEGEIKTYITKELVFLERNND